MKMSRTVGATQCARLISRNLEDAFVDHPPPHFFATYSGHEANVSIEIGEVIEGHLPANAARLVKQWALGASRRTEG